METRIANFYKLKSAERMNKVAKQAKLTDKEKNYLTEGLSIEEANLMIENVIGYMPIPLGIAVNFKINQRDIFIPMATEEPSVVAAASNAAKLTYHLGGFTTSQTESIMIGQIQLINVKLPYETKAKIFEYKLEILSICNEQDKTLINLGGGAKDINVRVFPEHHIVVIHLLIDTKDAMGANTVNTMVEAVTPFLERLIDGHVGIRIISNLADNRIVRARATFENPFTKSEENKFLQAYQLALIDPYRAATNNKGIMNGILAIALATGNDTRAIEAGAHAYASIKGGYQSLTHWELDEQNNIVGTIELPLAIGIVGGATRSNKVANVSLKILQVSEAKQLAAIMASVGLAQNFAALRALATEGIQSGHMRLHVANLAAMAGAKPEHLEQIIEKAKKINHISFDEIKRIVDTFYK